MTSGATSSGPITGLSFISVDTGDPYKRKIDPAAEAEYKKLGVDPDEAYLEVDGVPNGSLNSAPRENKTWSDCNVDGVYKNAVPQLQCRICKGTAFRVLQTDDYETTAECIRCHFYYAVHTG
jgi:hypothetical protein